MELFHGSYIAVEHPKIIKGRFTKDFGEGFNGILTREQFWVMAKFKYPTHQINFCTPAALKCINFIKSEEV